MADGAFFRCLRGALGNAVVWGAGWFTAAFALFAVLRASGILPETLTWGDGVEIAGRFGVVGGIAGGAFSSVIRLLYHGRRLSEISWVRFGIVGGVATGVFLPLFLQTMNLLFGGGLVPWELVLDDVPIAAVLGGAAAAGSLKLAQLSDVLPPGNGRDQIDSSEGVAELGLTEGKVRESPLTNQRD